MADEVVPSVEPAEVAALERAADAPKQDAVRASSGQAAPEPERAVAPPTPLSSTPKGALETLVEQAVGERLHTIEAQLAQQAQWLRHTMHLAMVLGHILRVDPAELDDARQKVDAADAAIRKDKL